MWNNEADRERIKKIKSEFRRNTVIENVGIIKKFLIEKFTDLLTLNEESVNNDMEKIGIKVREYEIKAREEFINVENFYVNFNTFKMIIDEL